MRNNKVECFHLRGLQYLTDRPELVRDRGKIFDQILNRMIVSEHLESSVFYNNRIKDTTFNADYDSTYTMDSSRGVSVPNGFSLRQSFGTDSISGSWTDYNFGTSVTQKANNMFYEYDYDPITYSITYNMNGGTNNSSNPSSYNVLYGVTLNNPTRTGYTFTGWKDANGNIVSGINKGANASFTSVDDMYNKLKNRTTGNQTLTAQWTVNNYKVTYNSNAKYEDGTDKNEISSVSNIKYTNSTKKYPFASNTLFPQKLVDIIKAGESTTITKDNKTVYSVNKDDIYYLDTNSIGTPYTFVGWSIYPDATINNGKPVYRADTAIDVNTVFEDILEQTPDSQIPYTNNAEIKMYAVWDKYPEIKSKNAAAILEDLQGEDYTVEDFENFLRTETIQGLNDREDGALPSSSLKMDILDEVLFNIKRISGTAIMSFNYRLTDSYGHSTTKLIDLNLTSSKPLSVKGPTIVELKTEVRFINEKYYNMITDNNGEYGEYSVFNYQKYGGLSPYSIWYTDPAYKATILDCFERAKTDNPEEIWYFTYQDILDVQQFVADNGIGKTQDETALQRFYDTFKRCKVKG